MRGDSDHEPDFDPRGLWQSQKKEYDAMTLERIYGLARTYDRQMRWVPVIVALSLVGVGVIGGLLWSKAHDTLARTSAVLFVAGEASAFLLGYRLVFPHRDPAESPGAYLRRRLRLKLAHLQGRWIVFLAPLLPFLIVSSLSTSNKSPGPLLPRLAPIAVLFAAWLFIFLMKKRSDTRQTKAQLDQLDELMDR
jgi:hypothetical protein